MMLVSARHETGLTMSRASVRAVTALAHERKITDHVMSRIMRQIAHLEEMVPLTTARANAWERIAGCRVL